MSNRPCRDDDERRLVQWLADMNEEESGAVSGAAPAMGSAGRPTPRQWEASAQSVFGKRWQRLMDCVNLKQTCGPGATVAASRRPPLAPSAYVTMRLNWRLLSRLSRL